MEIILSKVGRLVLFFVKIGGILYVLDLYQKLIFSFIDFRHYKNFWNCMGIIFYILSSLVLIYFLYKIFLSKQVKRIFRSFFKGLKNLFYNLTN